MKSIETRDVDKSYVNKNRNRNYNDNFSQAEVDT